MRHLPFLPLACVLAVACTSDDTDTGPDDTDTDVDDGTVTFEDFVHTTETPLGDVTCSTGDGTWLTQTPDPALQSVRPAVVTVLDFESDAPVDEANVDFWYGDDVSAGLPDVSGVTDENGEASLDVPQCTPISYKTWTDPELEITRDTYEAHQVLPPADLIEAELNSVSDVTYKIIPSLLGVSVQADKGIIAGTVYGCDDQKVENAQVVVKDSSGNIPPSLVVKYFVDDFPNRDQPDTSADGLWVAINVPAGEVTVEAYTYDGAAHVLAGATVVQSFANSINISNIYAGYGDGVKYPAECLLAE